MLRLEWLDTVCIGAGGSDLSSANLRATQMETPAYALATAEMNARMRTGRRFFVGYIVNALAASAVALFGASYLTSLSVIWNPGYYGDFYGMDIKNGSVAAVVPRSPAAQAGFKTGDKVDSVQPLASRILLVDLRYPRAGERFTVSINRAGRPLTLVAEAPPRAALAPSVRVIQILLLVALCVFVGTALWLVILRPQRLTWGFLLFSFVVVFESVWRDPSWIPNNLFLPYLVASDVLWAGGVVGFLVFCLRFPTDTPQRWGRALEACVPFILIVLAALYVYQDLAYTMNGAPPELTRSIFLGCIVIEQVVLVLGSVILLVRCFIARGLEREKLKWIVAGVIATSAGFLASALDQLNVIHPNPALANLLDLPYVGLSVAVAYTVIHHRVIDVRFVVTRAIVLSIIAGAVSLMIAALGWLSSTQLPNSRLQMAMYVGFAFGVGLLLNPAWNRVTKMIDAIYFKHWQRAQELAALVAGTVREANTTAAVFEPLTRGIAAAFSLSSAAFFERVDDGGFVRVADYGWPPETLWHVLPDEPLSDALGSRDRAKGMDAIRRGDDRLPSGLACPTILVPILVGRTVDAILLCGAHENGAAIDPDEFRLIRSLVSDCAVLYAGPGRSAAALRAAVS